MGLSARLAAEGLEDPLRNDEPYASRRLDFSILVKRSSISLSLRYSQVHASTAYGILGSVLRVLLCSISLQNHAISQDPLLILQTVATGQCLINFSHDQAVLESCGPALCSFQPSEASVCGSFATWCSRGLASNGAVVQNHAGGSESMIQPRCGQTSII